MMPMTIMNHASNVTNMERCFEARNGGGFMEVEESK
jgi:hypothetical protein